MCFPRQEWVIESWDSSTIMEDYGVLATKIKGLEEADAKAYVQNAVDTKLPLAQSRFSTSIVPSPYALRASCQPRHSPRASLEYV